ncbi:MAG: hypothetical protein R3C16_07055 [Hyphomonadaceae bacterium]
MAVAKKTASPRKKIVRIDIQPSAEAAEASKQLMVESQGYKASDISIIACQRVKLVAQGVSTSAESTFEDPMDSELFVVIGSK